MLRSKLEKGLRRALRKPAFAAEAIGSVANEPVRTPREAELVLQVLSLFPLPPQRTSGRVVGTALHGVVAWLQGAEDDEIIAIFKRFGAPSLLRIFDESVQSAHSEGDLFHLQHDLMFLLKVVCAYVPAGGLDRVASAARSPLLRDEFLWSIIFSIIANEKHPWQEELIAALRDPLPEGFAAVAYLDLANSAGRAGELTAHPFDSPEGHEVLAGWLSDRDEATFSYAHSAAAAIPFLSSGAQLRLLDRAANHPSRDVQLEAAWASAYVGREDGLRTLQEACADPRHALAALRYLEELGREDRIPVHTRSPDFAAMAEMCAWLAHPQEFGRPPRDISQVDTRELYWPPTDDRRQVWLFRYEYPAEEDEAEPDIGYGMVGSVTFALFGESTVDQSVEEVYGLHCAWELEMNDDPRASDDSTPAAGMAVIARYNPDFGNR